MKTSCVLCISGHDPGGGAGLHADIETVQAHGGHAFGIITCLTIQDTSNVRRLHAVEPQWLEEQLEVLLADCHPQAIKLGLIADAAQLPVIANVLARCNVPVVCDPVLRAGGGAALVRTGYLSALRQRLLPWVTVLTPNAAEARALVPDAEDLDACAAALLADGCAHVLITGGDEPGPEVVNLGYARNESTPRVFRWPRIEETFHGAGCTLASAIAARLAFGDAPETAIETAQAWTQQTLARAIAVGGGRRIPGRRGA